MRFPPRSVLLSLAHVCSAAVPGGVASTADVVLPPPFGCLLTFVLLQQVYICPPATQPFKDLMNTNH